MRRVKTTPSFRDYGGRVSNPPGWLMIAATVLICGCAQAQLADYTAVVDPSIQYQKFEGWGTSLAWWAHMAGGYPEPARSDYMEKIFDPVKGLGLTVVRYNVGGGENPQYLAPNKQFLQTRAAIPGFEPAPGKWDWTADENQRWVLTESLRRGVNRMEAFSNSPPYWMTLSGSVTGSKGGNTDNLSPEHYQDFSDYMAQVVQHFRDNWGITFNTLEPFNESSNNWWKFGHWQEGAHFDRKTQNTILGLLAPAAETRKLTTQLSAPDDNSIDTSLGSVHSYNPSVLDHLGQINTHSYGGSQRTELRNLALSLDKRLWMSEYGDGDASGITLSRRILSDLREMQPTAWVYWQAVDGGGWGLLKKDPNDTASTSYVLNPKYYVLAQYSRYIRPGFQFIAINDTNSVAAYGNIAHTLVIVTTGGKANSHVTYDLSRFSDLPAQAAAYRTSPTEAVKSLASVPIQSGLFKAPAIANSVTTYVVHGLSFRGAPGLSTRAYCRLINAGSGLALDVNGASPAPAAAVIQWNPNTGQNQQWNIVGEGAGIYHLVNRLSGMALDVNQSSRDAGASIIQWHFSNGANQRWKLQPGGNAEYKLVNQNSGLVLDVQNSSHIGGAEVVQTAATNSATQNWRLQPVVEDPTDR